MEVEIFITEGAPSVPGRGRGKKLRALPSREQIWKWGYRELLSFEVVKLGERVRKNQSSNRWDETRKEQKESRVLRLYLWKTRELHDTLHIAAWERPPEEVSASN